MVKQRESAIPARSVSPSGSSEPDTTRTHRLVFVCLHGSAKSVIAAAHCRLLAARRGLAVEVAPAGVEPDPAIPASVVEGLQADGIDVRPRRPGPATREALAGASRVVSFGCDLGSLVPPGVPIDRWDEVPPVSEGYDTARDAILRRLEGLLAECAGPPPATHS